MSTKTTYRIGGAISLKAKLYLEELLRSGWNEQWVMQFAEELPKFESAVVKHSVEDSRKAFIIAVPAELDPFLQDLADYIRIINEAELIEDLRRRATSETSKDSMEAHAALARVRSGGDGGGATAAAPVTFEVKDARRKVQVTIGKSAA